jgi:hypothetical protein
VGERADCNLQVLGLVDFLRKELGIFWRFHRKLTFTSKFTLGAGKTFFGKFSTNIVI